MTVKEEKWLDVGIRPWEELQTIHVLEEGSQQLAGDRSILGVCNNTRHFFSLKYTAKMSMPVMASDLMVFPFIIKAHITGSPVAAVKPSIVKWFVFVAAVSLGTVPLGTIFFWPPTALSPSWLVSPPTSSTKITISGLTSSYICSKFLYTDHSDRSLANLWVAFLSSSQAGVAPIPCPRLMHLLRLGLRGRKGAAAFWPFDSASQ